MAGTHQNQRQVVKLYTNGKRSDDRYALSKAVGQTVKRMDTAQKRAKASTARKASPIAKALITANYNIRPGKLTDKIRTRMDPDTLRVDASQRRFALIDFGGRWGGRKTAGATAAIQKGQTKVYAGSFITTIQGLRSIRVRQKRGSKRVGRGPVQILRAGSTHSMIAGRELDQAGNQVGTIPHGIAGDFLQQLQAFYVGELKRLYAVEASR